MTESEVAGGGDPPPPYMIFLVVFFFFLTGLLGFLVCHMLKKKGYRCRTGDMDDEEEQDEDNLRDDEEENQDTVEKILKCIIENEANMEAFNEMLGSHNVCVRHDPRLRKESLGGVPPHHHTVHSGSDHTSCHLCAQIRSKKGRRQSRTPRSKLRPGEQTVLSVGRFRVTHTDKKLHGGPNPLAVSRNQLDQSQDNSEERKDASYNLRNMFKDNQPPLESSAGTPQNVGKRRKSVTLFGLRRSSDPASLKAGEAAAARESAAAAGAIKQQSAAAKEEAAQTAGRATAESGSKLASIAESKAMNHNTSATTSQSHQAAQEPGAAPAPGAALKPEAFSPPPVPMSLPVPPPASQRRGPDADKQLLTTEEPYDPGPLQTSTPIIPGPLQSSPQTSAVPGALQPPLQISPQTSAVPGPLQPPLQISPQTSAALGPLQPPLQISPQTSAALGPLQPPLQTPPQTSGPPLVSGSQSSAGLSAVVSSCQSEGSIPDVQPGVGGGPGFAAPAPLSPAAALGPKLSSDHSQSQAGSAPPSSPDPSVAQGASRESPAPSPSAAEQGRALFESPKPSALLGATSPPGGSRPFSVSNVSPSSGGSADLRAESGSPACSTPHTVTPGEEDAQPLAAKTFSVMTVLEDEKKSTSETKPSGPSG